MTEVGPGRAPDLRFAPVAGLRVRHFDDEAIVFDPLSWDAHLLNPAALAVLEWLLETPRTASEVTSFLADALLPAERPRAAEHARRVIDDLHSLGVIQSIEDR